MIFFTNESESFPLLNFVSLFSVQYVITGSLRLIVKIELFYLIYYIWWDIIKNLIEFWLMLMKAVNPEKSKSLLLGMQKLFFFSPLHNIRPFKKMNESKKNVF